MIFVHHVSCLTNTCSDVMDMSAAEQHFSDRNLPWSYNIWYDPTQRPMRLSATIQTQPKTQSQMQIQDDLMMLFQSYIGGKPAKCLMDSGASHNFISSDLAKQLAFTSNLQQALSSAAITSLSLLLAQLLLILRLQIMQRACSSLSCLCLSIDHSS